MEGEKYIPIAQLENSVLVVKADDVPMIGKGVESLDVEAVVVDLDKGEVSGLELLERHLKFNPWEEVSHDQYAQLIQAIHRVISDEKLAATFSE